MKSILDVLDNQLPYYLTKEKKEGLRKALKDFPESMNYYLDKNSPYGSDLLQGDAIESLNIINYQSLEKKPVKAILLSNSCDLDNTNKRDLRVKAIFSPLIKLGNYKLLLEKKGIATKTINMKLQDIRKQKVTNIFYLPSYSRSNEEYIVLLDDVHSIPLKTIDLKQVNTKIFTLSQAGFYMFLFKLSIHFCRFHENIER